MATRSEGASRLSDSIFVAAVRYRLGMDVMEVSACQHKAQQKQNAPAKVCLERCDKKGHHAVLCKVGGAPYAAHSEGCHILHGASQQAGYQAKREQVIPELATPACKSPQLDVEGWGLQGQGRPLIDFTVRHPLASRYTKAGQTTSTAEGEKSRQYRPRQGLEVRAAVLEVFGRHGDGLTHLLEQLADHARLREKAMGLPPTRWPKRWRMQLSCTVAVYAGRAIQQAMPRSVHGV